MENVRDPNGMPKTAPHSTGAQTRAPSPVIVARFTKKLYETASPATGDSMTVATLMLPISQLPHATPEARKAPS